MLLLQYKFEGVCISVNVFITLILFIACLIAEILGAVISVLMIWVATGILVYLAIQRCITQKFDIEGKVMLITAGCGLAVNIMYVLSAISTRVWQSCCLITGL